jgi:hypothetical protein
MQPPAPERLAWLWLIAPAAIWAIRRRHSRARGGSR